MKTTPTYYAIIPAPIRYDKNLKANEKLMYGEITALSNTNGYCTASNRYFSELYAVSKETVSRWISNLQKLGYVSIEIIQNDDNQTIQRRIFIIDKTIKGIDEKVKGVLTKKSRGVLTKKSNLIIQDNNNTSINNKKHTKSSFLSVFENELLSQFESKKIKTFFDKVNLSVTKKNQEFKKLNQDNYKKIAGNYANYVKRNKSKAVRLNKWITAYFENNLKDIEFADKAIEKRNINVL